MNNFWMNKKVLVAGGFGFIGSYVIEALLLKGAVVTVTVRPGMKHSQLKKRILGITDKISTVSTDLLLLKDCVRVTKGMHVILHLAAMDGGAAFKNLYPADIFRTNTQMALNMLESARMNHAERILLMSSVDVYAADHAYPLREDAVFAQKPDDTMSGYVWAKRCIEIAARTYRKQYHLSIALARPANVYGPGDYYGIEKERVVASFIRQRLEHKHIHLVDGGNQKKQFIFVADVARALLDLTEKYAVCDPVNIAGREVISIKDLSLLIDSIISNRKVAARTRIRKNQRVIDITKLSETIGFASRVTLTKGLQRTIHSYRNNE